MEIGQTNPQMPNPQMLPPTFTQCTTPPMSEFLLGALPGQRFFPPLFLFRFEACFVSAFATTQGRFFDISKRFSAPHRRLSFAPPPFPLSYPNLSLANLLGQYTFLVCALVC